jgi:hypothetical protein
VWRSTTGGSKGDGVGDGTWVAMTNSQLTSNMTTIAVAPSDSKTVYAGTFEGEVEVTFDANNGDTSTWSVISNPTDLPVRVVTAVAADPRANKVAYVTYSGFSGFTDNLGHVFMTPDSSKANPAWTDISGNLPNTPVNEIVVDPDVAHTLYIGTDVGAFYTNNANQGGRTTWAPLGSTLNSGLPTVTVLGLKLYRPSRVLRAATHGRSAWDIALGGTAGKPVVTATVTRATLAGGVLTVTLQLKNTGSETARNLIIQTITTNGIQGGGTLTLTAPMLPKNLGDLGKNMTTTVMVKFNVTGNVTSFTMKETGTVQDIVGWPYPFTLSQKVTPQ